MEFILVGALVVVCIVPPFLKGYSVGYRAAVKVMRMRIKRHKRLAGRMPK